MISRTLFFTLLLISTRLLAAEDSTAIDFQFVNTAEEWQAVVQQAEADKKLLFVDVYTDWCGYCKMMDRDVFAHVEVGEHFNEQFVNVKLDAETTFGETFAREHRVTGYPTYLFLNAAEEQVGLIEGYVERVQFLKQAKYIEKTARKLPTLMAGLDEGTLTKAERKQLAIMLYEQDPVRARALAEAEIATFTVNDVGNVDNLPFIMQFGYDLNGPVWTLIRDNSEEVRERLGDKNFEDYLGRTYNGGLAAALTQEDPVYVDKVVGELLPIYLDNEEELPSATFVTKKIYYGNQANTVLFAQTVEDYYNEGYGKNDPDFWYNQAYEVIEEYNEGNMLSLVPGWLDRYLEENPEDFDALILYAYGLGMAGDYEGAMKKGDSAMEIAQSEEEIQLAREILDMVSSAQGGEY